jgi:hypothetical protein
MIRTIAAVPSIVVLSFLLFTGPAVAHQPPNETEIRQ